MEIRQRSESPSPPVRPKTSSVSVPSAAVMGAVFGMVFGLGGGLLGGWWFSPSTGGTVHCDQLVAKTVQAEKIVGKDILAETDQEGVACRMINGSLLASKVVAGAHIKGNFVTGRSVIASLNPTDPVENQKIAVEMAAVPQVGGTMIVRNKAGLNVPGQGPVKAGYAMFFGYSDQGTPLIYAHDIARGAKGIRPIVYSKPKATPKKSQATATEPTDPAQRESLSQNRAVAPPTAAHDPAVRPTSYSTPNRPYTNGTTGAQTKWNQNR